MTPTARRLLVAAPVLVDPNFSRTIVFVVEHTDEGALGVVLNRPSDAALDVAIPDWAPLAAPPTVAFVGGPVRADAAVIALARVARIEPFDGWQPLLGRVGTFDLGRGPGRVHPEIEAVRVFAGYAEWGPGQLDRELAAQAWFVVDARADDLLTADPATLWRRVLRRQGGLLAAVANFPDAPTSN